LDNYLPAILGKCRKKEKMLYRPGRDLPSSSHFPEADLGAKRGPSKTQKKSGHYSASLNDKAHLGKLGSVFFTNAAAPPKSETDR